MGDFDVYANSRRIVSEGQVDKADLRQLLDDHKKLPFLERIKENFSKELWGLRYDYYIKYASIRNLPDYY